MRRARQDPGVALCTCQLSPQPPHPLNRKPPIAPQSTGRTPNTHSPSVVREGNNSILVVWSISAKAFQQLENEQQLRCSTNNCHRMAFF